MGGCGGGGLDDCGDFDVGAMAAVLMSSLLALFRRCLAASLREISGRVTPRPTPSWATTSRAAAPRCPALRAAAPRYRANRRRPARATRKCRVGRPRGPRPENNAWERGPANERKQSSRETPGILTNVSTASGPQETSGDPGGRVTPREPLSGPFVVFRRAAADGSSARRLWVLALLGGLLSADPPPSSAKRR